MNEKLSLSYLQAQDPRFHTSGNESRFICPFPDCGERHKRDNSHRSLSANTETGAWTCHRCGRSGILEEYRNRPAAAAGTGPKRRSTARSGAPAEDPPSQQALDRLHKQMAGTVPLRGSPGEDYVHKRSIPVEVAEAAGTVFARSWLNQAAVVFPMNNEHGEPVAAVARSVSGSRKRVLGSKKTALFATPGALEADLLIITEGPFDALSFAAAGFPAVAVAGTTYPAFLRRLAALKVVLIATDADKAGEVAHKQLSRELGRLSRGVHRLVLPEGCKDPNDALLELGLDVFASQVSRALESLGVPRASRFLAENVHSAGGAVDKA